MPVHGLLILTIVCHFSPSGGFLYRDRDIAYPATGAVDHIDIEDRGQVLWLACEQNGTVEVLNAAPGFSSLIASVRVGRPRGVSVLPDGRAVVSSQGAAYVYRLFPSGVVVEADNVALSNPDNLLLLPALQTSAALTMAVAVEDAVQILHLNTSGFIPPPALPPIATESHPEHMLWIASASTLLINVPGRSQLILVPVSADGISGQSVSYNLKAHCHGGNYALTAGNAESVLLISCRSSGHVEQVSVLAWSF
eukprot:gene1323-2734_t